MQHRIKNKIQKALLECFQWERDILNLEVKEPSKEEYGDYSSNVALHLAKVMGEDPIKLGERLAAHMREKEEIFEKIEVRKPGFINFFLKDEVFYQMLYFSLGHYDTMINKERLWEIFHLPHGRQQEKNHLSPEKIHVLQYMYSRSHSIIRYFAEEGISLEDAVHMPKMPIQDKLEKQIIKKCSLYSSIVKNGDSKEILEYMEELQALFYQYHRGLLFRKLSKDRLLYVLKILDGIRQITGQVLEAMGLDTPEKM